MDIDFSTYLSPFTWRYGSQEMRQLWSEEHKRTLWRQIWVALAETQVEFGVVTAEKAADLRQHMRAIDMRRSLEIEKAIHHDLMAELRTFAEQSSLGGGILHLAATSADIEDNADVLRMRSSLDWLGALMLSDRASLGVSVQSPEGIDAVTGNPPLMIALVGVGVILVYAGWSVWRRHRKQSHDLLGAGVQHRAGAGAVEAGFHASSSFVLWHVAG